MAKEIDQLDPATPLDGTEEYPISQGGLAKRLKVGNSFASSAVITPGSDAKVTLTAAQNASKVRVLETGLWTQGWPVECDDANREFTVVNNSGFTVPVTTTGTTPTTVDVPSDGKPHDLQTRAGVGAEGKGVTQNATDTVVGGIKARLDGTDLYITFDGSDA